MQKPSILTRLAKRIRQLRKVYKMSQEQLAEKADLHPTFIGNIERAEKNPTITSLEKIARAFNIPLTELFTFPDDQKFVHANTQALNKALKFLEIAKELGESYQAEK